MPTNMATDIAIIAGKMIAGVSAIATLRIVGTAITAVTIAGIIDKRHVMTVMTGMTGAAITAMPDVAIITASSAAGEPESVLTDANRHVAA